MDLSVCIVNTNNKYFILNCLDSIYKNTKDIDFEVIVLDNNSTDGSPEAIKMNFPQVRLIKQKEKKGFCFNQNKALKIIQSEYALLLNEDTKIIGNSLKIMVDFIKTHPDAGAVTCRLLNADGSYQITSMRGKQDLLSFIAIKTGLVRIFPKSKIWGRPFLGHLDRNKIQEIEVFSGAAVLVRKKVLDTVGLLDEKIFFGPDDWDFSYRIRKDGWKIYYLPEARIVHYWGQTAKVNIPKKFGHEHVGIFYFYLKHYGKIHTFILKIIIMISCIIKISGFLLKLIFTKDRKENHIWLKAYWRAFQVSLTFPLNYNTLNE